MRAIAFGFQWPCRLLEATGRAFLCGYIIADNIDRQVSMLLDTIYYAG
jgi:hypothetical protein